MDPDANLSQTFGNMQVAGGSRGPSSQIQLTFSAKGLRNKDVLSKSDPTLVGYTKTIDGGYEEFGRTEVKPDTANPAWEQGLTILYHFEEVQPLRFVIVDVDSDFAQKAPEKLKLKKQDYRGEVRCMLAEIVASPHQVLTTDLHDYNGIVGRGALTIHAER